MSNYGQSHVNNGKIQDQHQLDNTQQRQSPFAYLDLPRSGLHHHTAVSDTQVITGQL